MMLPIKGSTLLLLLAAACLAIGSVKANEEKIKEQKLEEIEEAEDDYELFEDSEGESHKFDHPYGPPLPPPPPPPQLEYQLGQPEYGPPPPPPQVYYPVPVPNYTVPYIEEVAYNYEQPPTYFRLEQSPPPPVYLAPPPPPPPQIVVVETTYSPPVMSNYSSPPVYSAPKAPVYQQPPPVVANYSVPVVQKQANYVPQPAPMPAPMPVPIPTYRPQMPVHIGSNYSAGPQSYSQQSITKYSVGDLIPLVPFGGYRANHWSLHYYRASPYRACPKNIYLSGPSQRDLESALGFAQQQLAAFRGASINFMDKSQNSWAARHHVFSFLSQQSGRMDEEGLLLELISQYLADRACLTKWDKQRYLPQLTKLLSTSQFPAAHSCSNLYQNKWEGQMKQCVQSKYRTFDGFCNNPYHPYWGKSNVCHIRLLSPDYADGISAPRTSYNPRFPLPSPRAISNIVHDDIPLDGPYNHMKMQWGQFINHDITNTALSSYDGLVDCCKNPGVRGCWPIYVPPGDNFYGPLNVTCLSFIRSGVCPTCQLGPRQQTNKNTAFLDASHVYGQTLEQANQLRAFRGGLLKTSSNRNGEVLLPVAQGDQQCSGTCFVAGDSRVNQHPALTALHVLLLRNHNFHAQKLAHRHPNWNDEILFQEARRINIAEYQMITYSEYLPIVFGPVLSAYYRLLPQQNGYSNFEPKADPTTWNEYSTASCRFGHSQIRSTFGLYSKIYAYAQSEAHKQPSFRLKEWFLRPSLLSDGMLTPIVNGLLGSPSMAVDPWVTTDVRNHLYQSQKERSGGDLPATNIWRGRDHGIPGYVHYVEYCFNYRVRNWKDLSLFIPHNTLNQLRRIYRVPENIDLFTGGMSERHFPGADIGPTFACINGIQYYALKHGDRYFFEHANQVGSFNPAQLSEIKRSTLARLLCRTANIPAVPQFAFLQPSQYNPLVNCSQIGELNHSHF